MSVSPYDPDRVPIVLTDEERADIRSALAELFQSTADDQNDARDHDEYHAAADVIRLGVRSPYIDRWIEGLLAAGRKP